MGIQQVRLYTNTDSTVPTTFTDVTDQFSGLDPNTVADEVTSATITLSNLPPATTVFAWIEALDEAGNSSGIQPVGSATTAPQFDVWEFKALGEPGNAANGVVVSQLSWDQLQTLDTSMITTQQPTSTSPAGANVGVFLDNDFNTFYLWKEVTGQTLWTVTTPRVTLYPMWTVQYYRPSYRSALAIFRNGVQVYQDSFTSAAMTPNPYSVLYTTDESF